MSKVFYLHFTQDDFDASWQTEVIDLYQNNQYTNWATRKAVQGTDLTGNGIYTGLNVISPGTTEVGYLSSGRFIDTSAQIDLMTWEMPNFTYTNSGVSTQVSINVYTSPDATPGPAPSAPYSDWTQRTARVGQDLLVMNCNRYVFFELDITSDATLTGLEFDIYIRVEIDSAVVNGYFSKTLKLLNMFPSWMEMRELHNTASEFATPPDATPSSLGGKFLNAVAGEWLTDVAAKIQHEQYQHFIEQVDSTQKAWSWEVDNVPSHLVSVVGDGNELARCASLSEFYETTDTDDIFWWDETKNKIQLTHKYTTLVINGETYSTDASPVEWAELQAPNHIWNAFDDLGASVDLYRLIPEQEDNDTFRKRIMDVYRNRPGVGMEAFKLALRRELNLWYHMDSATPDSDWLGATPEVLEIEDIEQDSKYFSADGMPTDEFKALVNYLAAEYPILWGYFQYDRAFWDPDGLERKGIHTLPRLFDATPMPELFRQSGVGDMNDLYLFKPAEYTVPQEFTADLVVRGRQKSVQEAYPGLRFEVSLWGQADVSQYDNPEFSGNYTLLITDANADVWFANFTLSATTDTDINATPTSGSYAELNFATADGFTSLFLQFANTATGDLYTDDSATPASPQIDLSGITDLEILAGHWDVDLQTVINVPSQILYRLWFKHDPGTILGFGGSPSSISTSSYDWLTQGGDIVLESLVENFEEATPNDAATPALANWQSDIFHYTINIDGALPGLTKQSMSITVPHELINWPDDAIYRELYLQLETSNDGVTYGANSTEWAATPTFVDDTHISVNGDATWTDNRYKILDPDTTTITFSSEDGPDYPIDSAVWTLFEETYVGAVQGTVDANGPWRDDEPGLYGANNEILLYADVSRADFAIPETEDYILTWIGVANNDNPNVIVWLDSNTIKPAVAPPEEFQWAQKTYSAKAIEEYYDDEGATPYDGYRLSPFPVKAKLKLTVNERWHPNIHSGWFYDDTEEYYLYADKKIETATTDSHSLSGVNYQGAPIIVSGTPGHYLRQIHFWEMDYNATPATPNYTFTNTQEVYGTGTDVLYAAYHDIYDIDVYDMTLDQAVSITSTASSTNEIQTVDPTNKYHTYRLRYKVSQSYIVEVLSPDEAVVHFDQQPSNYGYASYTITYEGSRYDPATPIPIPLNTLHTAFDEGFVFIDHDAHDLQRIEVRISPSKVVAEDEDFLVIVIETYDIFGNPKPNIEVNLYTNYGLLSDSSVITDQDGRAHTVLTAYEWGADTPNPSTPALSDATPNDYPQGLILAEDTSTSKSTIAAFDIHRKQPKKSTLIAVMESDNILADGESTTYILGRVLDPNRNPISNVKIDWKKARTIYELFGSFAPHASPPYDNNGVTWTDSMGRFRIGPLVSDVEAGYWLAAIEGTDLYNAQVDFDNNNMSILASVTDISLDIQSVNAIVKQGKYVYATDAFDGQLLIFDVSDPNTPELVGYLNESELNSAADIIVEGDYCYIQGFGMSGVALVIVDVSDPTNPTTAAVTDIRCNSLVKDGRYCYVVSSSTDRLTVVDVANPTNPAEVGFVSDATALDNASGVCKDGDYCYVACSGGTGNLTVVDVSDPANPSIVGYLSDTSIAGAISVVKDGDLCYLASQTTDRLSIIDVSDPVNPTIVSYTDPSSLDGANKVVKHGDYCYVASSAADAVSVIDVSNPASPTIVGYITDSVLNGVSGLAFDNYICYAGGVSGGVGNGHLNVIQIPTTEPKIGDVVYWFEHPNINLSVDVVSGLPPLPIQQSTPTWFLPPYVYGSQFPVTVDEEDFYAGESATPSIQWNPPVWYAIDKYRQYHMGLSAIEGYYTGDVGGDGSDDPATPGYPDYVEY